MAERRRFTANFKRQVVEELLSYAVPFLFARVHIVSSVIYALLYASCLGGRSKRLSQLP